MGRTLRCGALTLALLAAAMGKAQAGDCWLLAGDELNRARQHGACRDTFARDPRNDGVQTAEVAVAPPVKRPRGHVAKVKKPSPDTTAFPSWSSPREPEPTQAVEATVVESGTNAVQTHPLTPADPVAAVVSGLRQDFDYFVYDLRRDFGAFRRMIERAALPRQSTE